MKVIRLKMTNCFLLQAGDKKILVDTGYCWEMDTLKQKLKEHNWSLCALDYLFITHCHDDHVGLVKSIIELNPKIKIVISKMGAVFSQTGKHNNIPGSGYINKRVNFILTLKSKFNKNWTHTFPSFIIRTHDIIIERDCTFEDFGINLAGKILLSPGHTLDHMSIVLDDGSCISGDAAANFPKLLHLNNCVISVNSLAQYYESWEKIINSKVKLIYPSHGSKFNAVLLEKNLRKNIEEKMVKWKSEYITTDYS